MNRRGVERWLVALLCAAVAWFYLWTIESGDGPIRFGGKQGDYYNLLLDGWAAGQLHLKAEVPAELLAVSDPHDLKQRPPGLGLHDTSLYRGKYYLYFGVAPAVVLMLPFRALTGVDLPLAAAVLGFTLGGFLASTAAWLTIRRRFFPEAGTGLVLTGVLALGLAGLGPVLVRRPQFWELPIAGGYCFAMLALAGVLGALLHERRAGWWLGAAGACLALAVASRVTYLVATPLLLAPLLARWRQRGTLPWREALGAAVPLAVIGALLAWHNYARFGDPWEFGQRYQLASRDELHMTHFALRYVPFNAWLYFWAPAQWTPCFPFLNGIAAPAGPAGHGGFENVYGVLTNLPLAWFALAAPLALRRREPAERVRLAMWLLAVALAGGASATLLLFFFGANGRYLLDFAPAWMLLAGVGGLAVDREVRDGRPWWRWSARTLWVGAVVFSAGFAVLFSLTTTDIFPKNNPRGYRALARRLNQLAAGVERIAGVRHGPVELTVRLPTKAGRPGERHALLVVGQAPQRSGVFVQYGERGRVQLGFAQEGGGAQLSRPLDLDATQPQRVRVALGSFWPPDAHPLLRGVPEGEIARLRQAVEITVNDEMVLEGQARIGPVGTTAVQVTPQFDDQALGHRFTGEVLAVKRDARPGVATEPPADCVRLRVALAPSTVEQPLASIGAAGREARLVFQRLADGTGRFGWHGAGTAPRASAPVLLADTQVHELLIKVARPAVAEPAAKGALRVVLDGVLVWSCRVTLPADAAAWRVDSPAETVLAEERFRDGADPLVVGRGAVRLTLRFPRGRRDGGREPLVVTGRPGEGDFLFVEYGNDGRLRFGFDHWGDSRRMISAPVAVDRTAIHELEIELGSLPREVAVGTNKVVRPGQVRVTLDGAGVFGVETAFHPPGSGELHVGRNPIGGSSCGPAFSGDLLRAARELPPAKE